MNYMIAREKERMGFVPAPERDGCIKCTHCIQQPEQSPGLYYGLRCTWGGFGTSARSICDRYSKRGMGIQQAADAATEQEKTS